jgi:hypothetical protein
MVGSLHLTLENLNHIVTLPGQAHFAMVDGKNTCRECAHWLTKGERKLNLLLKDAQCGKALKDSPPVPYRAWACKHFEANPTPPAI